MTWGTNPGWWRRSAVVVPDPADYADPDERDAVERALAYMALEPGTPIEEIRIDRVFIGSCTNAASRICAPRRPSRPASGSRPA